MGSRDRSDLVGKAETAKACNGDVALRDPANRIEAFIADAKALAPGVGGTRGRLVFALDATMSRQPTWDLACGLQAQMFGTAAAIGGLDVQLVYFRGFSECRASRWVADARGAHVADDADPAARAGTRRSAACSSMSARKRGRAKVGALVFVGDAMEEHLDELCAMAGEHRPARREGVHVPRGRRSRGGKGASGRSPG